MSLSVGAVAIVHQEQIVSCIEMIKSFRSHNPNSTIVLCSDGLVTEVKDICEQYNCSAVVNKEKLGYPVSSDIEVPLKYFYRLLHASLLIKEKYWINLEPDCLVTGEITIPYENYDFVISQDNNLQWIYYFANINDKLRGPVINSAMDYYKKHNVYREPFFDKIMGGGGDIFNSNITKKIISDWDVFRSRAYDFKNICDTVQTLWYHDLILSFQIPFYFNTRYGGPKYFENLTDLSLQGKIFHRIKCHYV